MHFRWKFFFQKIIIENKLSTKIRCVLKGYFFRKIIIKKKIFQPKSDAMHQIMVERVIFSTTFQPKSDALHRILLFSLHQILVESVMHLFIFEKKHIPTKIRCNASDFAIFNRNLMQCIGFWLKVLDCFKIVYFSWKIMFQLSTRI